MNTNAVLEVTNLRTNIATARGTITPVAGVSFELQAGETLGLVGESGSGKSMLVRSVMGLLPPGTSLGSDSRVIFDGTDLTHLDAAQLRSYWGSRIALVPQDPVTSLNPVRKIGAQVTDPLRVHGKMSRAEAREKAVDLLRSVGIAEPAERLNLYPHEISGGMRQRVLIATAVALSPALLIADEPTTALDVTVQRQVLDLISALKESRGMAVILVSHDLSVVAGHCDRVAVMYAGQLVEVLPASELISDGCHPYTRGLLASHPGIDAPSNLDLAAIPGDPPDITARPAGCPFAPRCPNALPVCLTTDPELLPIKPGHTVACHNPVTSSSELASGQPTS